jgi:hypothetical protein
MRERNGDAIRSIAWAELFPWLNIFKTFRLAIGFRSLAMSALAVLLMATCWAVFGHIFSTKHDSTRWLDSFAACPWKELTEIVPDQPSLLGQPDRPLILGVDPLTPEKSSVAGTETKEPIKMSWTLLSQPLFAGFGIDVTFGDTLCLLCCGLSSLAIWSFFGGAITRIAAVQLAANERITWMDSLRYSCSKFFAYFFAPLFPLGGIALLTLVVVVFAWLLRFGFGAMIAGTFLWPLFLIAGLTIALLLVGLLFGWPLMWPTISTEGTDSFDALSRSYAAVYQRPLHYLFYFAVAAFLGLLGWIFVRNFASAVVWTTYWAASWGAGADRIKELMTMHTLKGDPLTGSAYFGAWMIHFWTGLAKLVAVGFCFSFFWNAYAAIYLLLRRDVDATEMDEVYLDADEGEAKFGLPKIVLDDAGAPEVEERAKAAPEKPAPVEEKPIATAENLPEAAEKPPAVPENTLEVPPTKVGGGNEPTPSSPI